MSAYKVTHQVATAGTALKARVGRVVGVFGVGDGAAMTVQVHDGSSISDPLVFDYQQTPGAGIPYQIDLPEGGVRCRDGIFVVVTGLNVSIAWE